MTLEVVNQAEEIMLDILLAGVAAQNLDLKLYKSNTTPADADTEATYTEADFTGYAAIQLVQGNWVTTQGDPTTAAYPQQTFTSSADQAAQSVYGYYVIQRVSGKLMWAERFTNGPYVIANNGDTIKVTLAFNLKDTGD